MSTAETTTDEHAETASPRRRGLRRMLISIGALGLVLALVVGGGLWFLTDRYAGNVDRVADAFGNLDAEARPATATTAQQATEQPVTVLLVGSDSLAPPTTGSPTAAGPT